MNYIDYGVNDVTVEEYNQTSAPSYQPDHPNTASSDIDAIVVKPVTPSGTTPKDDDLKDYKNIKVSATKTLKQINERNVKPTDTKDTFTLPAKTISAPTEKSIDSNNERNDSKDALKKHIDAINQPYTPTKVDLDKPVPDIPGNKSTNATSAGNETDPATGTASHKNPSSETSAKKNEEDDINTLFNKIMRLLAKVRTAIKDHPHYVTETYTEDDKTRDVNRLRDMTNDIIRMQHKVPELDDNETSTTLTPYFYVPPETTRPIQSQPFEDPDNNYGDTDFGEFNAKFIS